MPLVPDKAVQYGCGDSLVTQAAATMINSPPWGAGFCSRCVMQPIGSAGGRSIKFSFL
nr:MAG TPA: hypothetical protein [Caudoviricetes sp.]